MTILKRICASFTEFLLLVEVDILYKVNSNQWKQLKDKHS